jgi:rhodanese-related sulfurtransferase
MIMHKILILGILAALGLSPGPAPLQERKFDAEAARLLDDRTQPWWNNHKPPTPKKPVEYRMQPSDDLGGRTDPPIFTPKMPVELAAWLHAGGRPAEGHPLAGLKLVLLDVRRRSDFLAEHIKGSLNIPGRDFEASLESGDLSKLDPKTLLVVYGSRWAHYEIVSKLRPKGFVSFYAMEGLEAWKAKGAPVERDETLVRFLKEIEPERRASEPPPAPPEPPALPGMDARALKTLLDAGVDLLCVFVGDRRTYEDGHVPGAHHVPVATIPKWFADVDRNRLIMVMCGCCMGKRGGPSENGIRELEKMGFTRVLHLDGHMHAWKTAGLPVQTEDPPPRK